MSLTLIFAVCAGIGAGAAWGYRTALYVALGREGRLTNPRPPREPQEAKLPVPFTGTPARRDELAR